MKTLRFFLVALVIGLMLPPLVLAQDNPNMHSFEVNHDITEDLLLASIDLMDEDMLAYRPTVSVRTSAQIFGHIINAQYGICSTASGGESPAEGNYEEIATTKDEIQKALQASFEYCRGVYASMTDEESLETMMFFGGDRRQEMTKAGILSFNSVHNYEHYGQLTVYMRMNGMTPPSSAN